MKSDSEIKYHVEQELRFTAELDATDIAVAVENGVVTLTGFARSQTDRYRAEGAARHIWGVISLVNNIRVRLRRGRSGPEARTVHPSKPFEDGPVFDHAGRLARRPVEDDEIRRHAYEIWLREGRSEGGRRGPLATGQGRTAQVPKVRCRLAPEPPAEDGT
ncbi:BON domain-containing protein [Inquilinus sp. OTU3971]|uniref:BON domain-containing protein n=1 Tax=Inquilinus sp. OTU3971 TaxID=3043855 RepID=UPI00313D67CF